jgi:hypothetical protein
MKQLIIILLLISFQIPVISQDRGNEWINYDQKYYRISVTEDGIQHISYQSLVTNGFPADAIDPRWIQIFHEGQEQYIYIEGENTSGIFDPNGFIEFYGQRNRGYRDTILYDEPENCINPDYSLFTDTAIYYITWNSSFSNRRIQEQTDTDFQTYASNLSSYCTRHIRQNYTGYYNGASTRCIYTEGEGWLDASRIQDDISRTKTISTAGANSNGPDAIIEIAAAGTPNEDFVSYVPHQLKVNFLEETQIDEIYDGYEFVKKTLSFPSSSIDNQISFVFSSNDTQSPNYNDYNRVSYIDITYSHDFDFENSNSFEFQLPSGSGAKDYLEITNFQTTGTISLYDIDQHIKITTITEDDITKALIPNNGEKRHLILCNEDGFIQANNISPVTEDAIFTDYLTTQPNTDYLIITHTILLNGANLYKNYRNETGFTSGVYNIQELYDQYAYGVKKHPFAIRNLIEDIYDENGEIPKFLFLLGKGINTATSRNNVTYFNNCLVPSYGNPSSDILYTAEMHGTGSAPLIPTGRLAAKTNQEIEDYLNKVIEYESNPVEAWMKNIMHFGGGATSDEQTTFANYLSGYEDIIEDTLFGGYVHTFLKNSSDPIQISTSDSVRNLIINGTTMMCFFGHASATGFDQNIDNPENYSNTGKYPFILANSCYSGNIHLQYSESTSEDWVLIPEKGAIGFLASVGLGLPSYLNRFSDKLYRSITYKNYGESIGFQQQQATISALESYPGDYKLETTCHEMTLHADPAIHINYAELPDLSISSSDLEFEPDEINTILDSFNISLRINNIGRAFSDTFLVHIERTYPDNSQDILDIPVYGSLYIDTLVVKLPVKSEKSPGMNKLNINLDYYDEIEELSEINNSLSTNFLITSGSIFPIYPYEYAIFPDATVRLKASSGSPFSGEADYIFQMDTTDLFNSNLGAPLYTNIINSPGGVVEWTPPVSLEENRVYYWRVATNNPIEDSIHWNESSFIYIPGQEGWSQAHYFQFKNDKYTFIDYDREERDFDYIETPKQLHCHNQAEVWTQTYNDIYWSFDGAIMDGEGDYGCCGQWAAMMVVVIDPVTLKAWPSSNNDYGHRNYPRCFSSGRDDYFYVFSTGSMQSMNNLLLNEIPDDYYVLVYSWVDGYFESWEENVINTFEDMGANEIRDLPNHTPYTFFCQKGHPETAKEKIGTSPDFETDLYVNLSTAFNYGTIESTIIGPSNHWSSLHWFQESIDTPTQDSSRLEILSYDPITQISQPIDTIYPDLYDVYNLNNEIPADENPYIKLKFWTRDDSTKTPGQINKWQIMYSGIPETAINPQAGFYISSDTILRGEDLVFSLATENISPYDMDSLLVKYWIQTNNNQIIDIGTKRLRKHPAGDIISDTLRYSSVDLTGLNSIWIEYNPINESNGYDQAEQYHFNNIAQYFFYVSGDNENPILDITFDGIHILDEDIVSAKPEILITLNDENQYLILNDTSLFRFYLTSLNTGEENRIYFRDSLGNEILEWTPASLPKNIFRILYHPEFIEDGIYQLRIQATDASGNESGDFDYTINFEIITESSITHILNYPNPFSSSTRFVFELTGSTIPDEIRIEIYTVTGKLVKVISQVELGPINIGRNISEYAWNGTDMYGDQLANGVYFYRVKTKIQGENIDHRSNESDTYFKAEIGKMYLMR